jgi:hypothetical protein
MFSLLLVSDRRMAPVAGRHPGAQLIVTDMT